MTTEFKLKRPLREYMFTLWNVSTAQGKTEPIIVLCHGQRLIAYTSFADYNSGFEDHGELNVICEFLTFVLHNMKRYGINKLTDIPIDMLMEYFSRNAKKNEKDIVRHFLIWTLRNDA